MKRVATLTMNPSIDLSTSVEYVMADRKLRCRPLQREPGGGGINVSRVIDRLSGTSIVLYPAGGPAGQVLQNLLEQEGIKHHPIPIEGWTRENFTILEEATGQQFRFGMPGPFLSQEEWKRCLNEMFSLDPAPAYIVASESLAHGKVLRDAVRFGIAAGTAAVITPGTELCRREDTERLYR